MFPKCRETRVNVTSGQIKSIIDVTVANSQEEVTTTLSTNFPDAYSIKAAYPNPFNPSTTLEFELPMETDVSIVIYNLQGQVVSTLIEGAMELGYHSIIWDASQFSSGVYFIQFIAGEYSTTQKLMLIK